MSELTAVSLFAGIEGFGLALDRCGVTVKASVEIDAECRGVIARHFPQVKLFNDVRTVTGDELRAAGFVPERGILTGGFPCQDLSIAGRRAGLGGARSGLFWEIMRLADELSPRWLILENVPGLLSAVCSCPGDDACTANGRAVRCGEWRTEHVPGDEPEGDECPSCGHHWDYHDAGLFCASCGGTCEGTPAKLRRFFVPNVPHGVKGGACAGGCMPAHGGAMGTVLGALGKRGYGFAGRVLDSQFFGVPQRRERVFIVGCLGDWAAPVEILLEPEGGDRNLAARGTARQGAPGNAPVGADRPSVTGTLTPGMLGDYDDNTARAGFMVTAPTLTAGWGTNHGAPGHGGKDDAALAVTAATLQGGGRRGHRIDAEGAAGGHLIPLLEVNGRCSDDPSAGTGVGRDGDPMFTLQAGKQHAIADVTHAITARESKGADSDATSGFIVAPVALRGRDGGGQIEAGLDGDPAFTLRTPGGGSSYPMVTHALTSEGADASEDGTGGSKARLGYSDKPTALRASQVTAVHAVPVQDGRDMAKSQNGLGVGGNGDPAYTVDTTGAQAVSTTAATAVRRLTPLECERLQAFPDEWTRWKLVNGELVEQSDSARYRQLGNAVTTSVPEWILRHLVAADLARGSEAGAA